MHRIFWVVILITGFLILGSGCIQSKNQSNVPEPEPTPSLYETPEAMSDYYTLYRHNDTLENFTEYFFESVEKDHINYLDRDICLKEHQKYLEYLEKTPGGSFAEYLPLRYNVSYKNYQRDQPQVTFPEYLLRYNREYAYQILGALEEYRLRLYPIPEGNQSLYPYAHPLSREEAQEIPVLYEILLCNLTDPARVFEPEIEKLQPYNKYSGQPFIWNGSYYHTRFSAV